MFKLHTMLNYILISVVIVIITRIYINENNSQLQMIILNNKIVQLTQQYDKLCRNININHKYPSKTHSYDFINAIKSPDRELLNLSEIYRNDDNNNMPLMKSKNNSNADLNKMRYFLRNRNGLRTFKIRNLTTMKDEKTDVDISSQKEPQIKRLRRNIRSSRKRQQNKRKLIRKRKQLEHVQNYNYPLVATFAGAVSEQYIINNETGAIIGPWMKKSTRGINDPFDFTKFHLICSYVLPCEWHDEGDKWIHVSTSGLYMISAQIFYYGEATSFSYDIVLELASTFQHKELAKCLTTTSYTASETMCYTSVVTYLESDDKIGIRQRELDRHINLENSQIQLVMFAKTNKKIET